MLCQGVSGRQRTFRQLVARRWWANVKPLLRMCCFVLLLFTISEIYPSFDFGPTLNQNGSMSCFLGVPMKDQGGGGLVHRARHRASIIQIRSWTYNPACLCFFYCVRPTVRSDSRHVTNRLSPCEGTHINLSCVDLYYSSGRASGTVEIFGVNLNLFIYQRSPIHLILNHFNKAHRRLDHF